MLRGAAVNQGVDKKSPRSQIDNRCASDACGIKTSARGVWDGQTNINSRPDRQASRGVKRIDTVRFSDRNDHWTVRAALNVKRLGVNVAGDRSVEAKIAC